jgi:hypothetical protein
MDQRVLTLTVPIELALEIEAGLTIAMFILRTDDMAFRAVSKARRLLSGAVNAANDTAKQP